MPVVVIPTHLPVRRTVRAMRGFTDEESKWRFVAEQARALKAKGQPVLIGTRTVAASESLAKSLNETVRDDKGSRVWSHHSAAGRMKLFDIIYPHGGDDGGNGCWVTVSGLK